MWEERLDRIEALIEKIGNRVDSNARAIEALTSAAAQERTQRQRAERRLYESMARMSDAIATIGAAQSSLWEVQADYYRRLEEMDSRQATMIDILNRLTTEDRDN